MYSLIIVDDERIVCTSVASFIRENTQDFDVVGTYSDGADALKDMQNNPVDVVITDIRMATMSGLELARHISRQWPACCIVIISGYNDFNYAKEAMEYGVLNYILKPIDFEELSDCLLHLKQRLDRQKSLSLINMDFTPENVELFFSYLLAGKVKSQSEIEPFYNRLRLPFSLYDHAGQIINLTVKDKASQWIYGREALNTAFTNVLQMNCPEDAIYPIFRKGWNFYFVMIHKNPSQAKDTADSHKLADKLADSIRNLLHIQCAFHRVCPFKNILELAQNSRLTEVVSFPVPDFPENETQADAAFPTLSDNDRIVEKAKQFIKSNYASDLTREDVANAVFLSPSYLSRIFKLSTGISFSDYLTNVRMDKAIGLLSTGMRISEITEKVGYHSRNTFLVNFRHY